MAAVMNVEQMRGLLHEAAQRGCTVVWMEAGALQAGASVGKPRYAIDFVHERLVASSAGERDSANQVGRTGSEANRTSNDRHPLQLIEPSAAATPNRRTGNYSLILQGKIIPAISYQSLLLAALETIEHLRPGTLDKLSRDRAKSKRVIARERDFLYAKPRPVSFSKQIEGGWWVATNNSGDEVEKFIRRAAFHAGLDVEIRR